MPQFISVFENALPEELCASLIAQFEADKRVTADPQPDYSTRHYINTSLYKEWRGLSAKTVAIANKLTKKYFNRKGELDNATHKDWSDDGYIHDAQCVVYAGPDAEHTGKEICFGYNEDTFSVIDVTDPSNPSRIGLLEYENTAYTHQGWVTDDHRTVFLDGAPRQDAGPDVPHRLGRIAVEPDRAEALGPRWSVAVGQPRVRGDEREQGCRVAPGDDCAECIPNGSELGDRPAVIHDLQVAAERQERGVRGGVG